MVEGPVSRRTAEWGPVSRSERLSTVMASTPIVTEPYHGVRFKEWLASHGGSFHSRYSSGECDRTKLDSEVILVSVCLA